MATSTDKSDRPVLRRILILGAYGTGNLGDELILSSMAVLLRRAYPEAELRAFSYDPEWNARFHSHALCAIEPYRWCRHSLSSLVRGAWRSGVDSIVRHRATDAQIEWSQLLVLGGGNLLADGRFYFLEHLTGQIVRRAYARGVPAAVLGAGYGPVTTERGHHLMRDLAQRYACAFAVREATAADALRAAGASDVELIPDPVLLCPPDVPASPRTNEVILNVRPFIGAPPWRVLLGPSLEWLETRGPVWGVPADVRQDVAALRTVLPESRISTPPTPYDLARIISRARYVVAARLHCCILAAAYGVPFVALSYHEKVREFVERLGAGAQMDVQAPAEDAADILLARLANLVRSDASGLRSAVAVYRGKGFESLRRMLGRLPFRAPRDPSARGSRRGAPGGGPD